jgi:O-antigen/teichoic acid export membrane protein
VLPLQILLVGFVLCSFAQIPFTDIQARGRSDLTAKIHLLEVVPFLAVMLYLSDRYGAIGAAVAWTLRNFADYALLSLASRSLRA